MGGLVRVVGGLPLTMGGSVFHLPALGRPVTVSTPLIVKGGIPACRFLLSSTHKASVNVLIVGRMHLHRLRLHWMRLFRRWVLCCIRVDPFHPLLRSRWRFRSSRFLRMWVSLRHSMGGLPSSSMEGPLSLPSAFLRRLLPVSFRRPLLSRPRWRCLLPVFIVLRLQRVQHYLSLRRLLPASVLLLPWLLARAPALLRLRLRLRLRFQWFPLPPLSVRFGLNS